jgi:hypothetical protein
VGGSGKQRIDDTTKQPWQILSPLSKKDTGIIRCIGLNFKDHAVCYRLTQDGRWKKD